MSAYRTDLVRKIVRLLEGEHDGEVANAARKLVNMAKEQGHNLDEMLADVYGGGAAKSYKKSSPASAWDDAMRYAAARRYAYEQTAAAEEARRQSEERARERREEADKRRTKHAQDEEHDRANRVRPHFKDDRLALLSELFDEFGSAPLTLWESVFVGDILAKSTFFTTPTPRQLDSIDRILSKYRAYKVGRGDEKSFWNA